jgi:hypothetical protein
MSLRHSATSGAVVVMLGLSSFTAIHMYASDVLAAPRPHPTQPNLPTLPVRTSGNPATAPPGVVPLPLPDSASGDSGAPNALPPTSGPAAAGPRPIPQLERPAPIDRPSPPFHASPLPHLAPTPHVAPPRRPGPPTHLESPRLAPQPISPHLTAPPPTRLPDSAPDDHPEDHDPKPDRDDHSPDHHDNSPDHHGGDHSNHCGDGHADRPDLPGPAEDTPPGMPNPDWPNLPGHESENAPGGISPDTSDNVPPNIPRDTPMTADPNSGTTPHNDPDAPGFPSGAGSPFNSDGSTATGAPETRPPGPSPGPGGPPGVTQPSGSYWHDAPDSSWANLGMGGHDLSRHQRRHSACEPTSTGEGCRDSAADTPSSDLPGDAPLRTSAHGGGHRALGDDDAPSGNSNPIDGSRSHNGPHHSSPSEGDSGF